MKQQWKLILGLCVFLSLVGAGLVYWFVYRPDDIRKVCAEEAIITARPKAPWDKTKRRVRSYEDCLKENGVE